MIFAKQFAKLTWTFPAVKNAGSLHSSQRNCRNHCVQCGKRLYQIGKCLLQKYEQLQQRITALTAEYDGSTHTMQQQLLRVVAYLVPEAEN
ncbi:hypothetical protein T02_2895 [Trichinella nativa]|uniref:Uncharacterized protein n=1 Tax=Trichinella nativa TaxID=6335 RepID=A0A0V1KMG2_9BILA|nr:hypothetical protein T02_14108 [Trichinella nativa]KRZ49512.1 hypothetical protein T02_2895 [Trichinella nativa]